MCTLGALKGKYLFKNRDMAVAAGLGEEVLKGQGRYRYVGIAGHASPREKGLNSGINEVGVSAAMTFVDQVSLPQALETRTSRGVLVEKILRETGTLGEALQLAVDFFHRHPLVGGNIVILTPSGGAVIEQLYPRISFEMIVDPVTVRTNHFLNLTVSGDLAVDRANSQARFQRFGHLLKERQPKSWTDIKDALADHEGEHPICRHGQQDALTVSTAIYDLSRRTLHYCYGHLCSDLFQQYAL